MRADSAQSQSFEDGFEGLFDRAYQAAFRVLGDRQAAEDVALETMTRTWAKWPSVADHAAPWVVTVAGGLAIDEWRRQRRQALRAHPGAPPPAPLELAELRVDLQRSLAGLPRRQRQVALLRYFADLAEADIAAELDCSPGTVKQHARRALDALRRRLPPDYPTTPDRKEDTDVPPARRPAPAPGDP